MGHPHPRETTGVSTTGQCLGPAGTQVGPQETLALEESLCQAEIQAAAEITGETTVLLTGGSATEAMKGRRRPEKAAGVMAAVAGQSIRLGQGLGAPGPGRCRLDLPPGLGALRLRLQTQGMPAKSAECIESRSKRSNLLKVQISQISNACEMFK